jgi:glutamine amidotransferase
MKTVTVIDYGMSNLRSVTKALEYVAGNRWHISLGDKAEMIRQADKIVFPGQGAIGNCMTLLEQTGMIDAIKQALESKPFLGICLGLQMLLTHSEESGGTAGFDWVKGTVRRFAEPLYDSHGERLKIPHMGWNQVQQDSHPLWQGIADNSRFYFVHSYYVASEAFTVGKTTYGSTTFTSALAKDNVFAIQFHPEKSQQMGLTLLKNFLAW